MLIYKMFLQQTCLHSNLNEATATFIVYVPTENIMSKAWIIVEPILLTDCFFLFFLLVNPAFVLSGKICLTYMFPFQAILRDKLVRFSVKQSMQWKYISC